MDREPLPGIPDFVDEAVGGGDANAETLRIGGGQFGDVGRDLPLAELGVLGVEELKEVLDRRTPVGHGPSLRCRGLMSGAVCGPPFGTERSIHSARDRESWQRSGRIPQLPGLPGFGGLNSSQGCADLQPLGNYRKSHRDRSDMTAGVAASDGPGGERPLIICGMHRSGTSFVASLVAGAGVHLGDELLESSPGNPRGHFEDVGILDFHRTVLIANGIVSEGYTTQATIALSPSLRRQAADLLAARAGRGRTWGWKEPRTTLFLDVWQTLVPEARFLLLFRRPWEVVDSLFRRGETTFRHNPAFALDVWLHYNRLLLEFATRAGCATRSASGSTGRSAIRPTATTTRGSCRMATRAGPRCSPPCAPSRSRSTGSCRN